MDSNSQFFGEAEECNSSESGWTMYIGSPSTCDGEVENNGDFDELEDNNYNREGRVNEDDEDEDGDTDDSMASDASSGPISHFSRNGKSGGVAMVNFKNSKEKGKEKDCSFSNNKAKSLMKNGYKNDDQDKVKESIFAAKGTKGASNGSNNKVRKSIWRGKGK
ncbi:protein SOB FIVE-LIKE 4-like [Solanum dulcamara]|uniref:protein SOB FIVE-LIKE 4-like n=1 Tax=Solanum dulcamara TaxID=45834 RepID=UPI0024860EFB|nr:protein SOB FIVE-LIKE 4-like [Solanum dulcamara]